MSLVNTVMQPLWIEYDQRLDSLENRRSKYGALNKFQDDTENVNGIVSPDTIDAAYRSFGRSVAIPVIDYKDVTIGSSYTCTVADDLLSSQLFTLTWVPYAFGWTMTPASNYNNVIDYENEWRQQYTRYMNKFLAVLDSACIARMEADKNTYFPAAITTDFGYTASGNALRIPLADKEEMYNNMESIMNTMDFYGTITDVTTQRAMGDVRKYFAQGAANSTNLSYQLAGYRFYPTSRVTNGVGVQSTHYLSPEGCTAIFNRNAPEAIQGYKIHDGEYWDVIADSELKMDLGYRYKAKCDDRTALGGATTTASAVEEHLIYTYVCFLTSYVSDRVNRYAPILKVEVLTT